MLPGLLSSSSILHVLLYWDLKPDYVSKAALQENLNCEKVCEKPSSTSEERAIARIASHPLVYKKIAAIKAAVNSFKEAREKNKDQKFLREPQLKTESLKPSRQEGMSHSKTNKMKRDNTIGEKSKPTCIKQASAILEESEPEVKIEKCFSNEDATKVQAAESALVSQVTEQTESRAIDIELMSATPEKSKPEALNEDCFSQEDTSKNQAAGLVSQITEEKKPAQLNIEKRIQVSINSHNTKPIEEDKSVDEEEDYFDDSTEERFYNQSSSDESGDDDFFIGKVKRTNKRKQESDPAADVNIENDNERNMPIGLKEIKSNLNRKKSSGEQTKFGSLFCGNLSSSKASVQKSNLQGQVKNKKSAVQHKSSNSKKLSFREKSQGKCGDAIPKPQQSLHPSWEASRRRKEQIQIVAFQGKKIRFDD
ncbi:serum response factor-binding protein 1 isoform X2 [Hypanus sabinus]|uniref:serum response factor-binding protein 1 isoform X2 n=1 Tax=Hypanus sabinus TaxID=79690 RepID=UPI0028C4E895|nr:serum response factor-binding protein 1 isoform X2 [Hypanus sabinus]